MADEEQLLNAVIEIADPEDASIKYEFRIPGTVEQMKLGMRARAIRRQNDPGGSGDLIGLDQDTAMLSWSFGAFEILLLSSGAKWPYSKAEDGKPVVDYTKFPSDKVDTVMFVGYKLDAELARFREKRVANWNKAGQEAVDGVGNPGA